MKRDLNELWSSVGKKLAEAVAKHPMLNHQLSGRAKAIRMDELITVLQDLAKNPPKKLDQDAKRVLQNWAQKIAPTPEALAVANALRRKIEMTMPGYSAEFQHVIEQTIGAAGRLQDGVERWFDNTIDRTSDVFLRWTKAITITAALVLAFGFHVDSIDIYKQISTNAEVRAKLGTIADETAKKAADILTLDTSRIATKIQADHKADEKAKVLAAMPAFQRCEDAANWMSAQKVDDTVICDFKTACQQQALVKLDNVSASLSSVKAGLASSGLHLTSGDYSSPTGWWQSFWNRKGGSRLAHLFGVLATVFLLSLGAPFWFNTLRQLCAMKPAIARKIDQEQQQPEPALQPAAKAKPASA